MKSTLTLFSFLLLLFCSTQPGFSQTPGNTLDFDGAGDRVECPLPSIFDSIPSSDITVEAWVNPASNSFSRIVYAQNSTSNFLNFSLGTNGQIYFYVNANGTPHSSETNAFLTTNQWTHVACRWTASTQSTDIYFNGVLQAVTGGGGSSTGSNGSLTLGSRPGGAQYFDGQIDEVRIWREARSECEILSNFMAIFPGPTSNLVAYYNFDIGTPGGMNTSLTTLPDLSGAGNDGVLSGFSLSGAGSNWIASTAGINATGPLGGPQIFDSTAVCRGITYTFPDGSSQVIDSTTVQTSIMPSPNGCDSSITTTVSVLASPMVFDTASVCAGISFTFPDGSSQVIDSAITQTSILTGGNGCDSTIVTTVMATSVDTQVMLSSSGLMAQATNATFQWLNCDSGFTIIPNATAALFTPAPAGNYAVEITQMGCIDTSACTFVNLVSIAPPSSLRILLYPNPNDGRFKVVVDKLPLGAANLSVIDLTGRSIFSQNVNGDGEYFTTEFDLNRISSGIYYLQIQSSNGKQVKKLVIE